MNSNVMPDVKPHLSSSSFNVETVEQAHAKAQAQVERWYGEVAHRAVLETAQPLLAQALLAAGFEEAKPWKEVVASIPEEGQFTTWTRSQWRHPECPWPFNANLYLDILFGQESFGRVSLAINFCDSTNVQSEAGVLRGEEFHESVVAAKPLTQERLPTTFEVWQLHVSQGVQVLTPAVISDLVARSMARLEAVTTP